MDNRKQTINVGDEQIDVWKVDNDMYGNPRYVVHFLAIPFRERYENEPVWDYYSAHTEHARKALGGRRYRAKWFGGGIVFQSYNIRDTLEHALGEVK